MAWFEGGLTVNSDCFFGQYACEWPGGGDPPGVVAEYFAAIRPTDAVYEGHGVTHSPAHIPGRAPLREEQVATLRARLLWNSPLPPLGGARYRAGFTYVRTAFAPAAYVYALNVKKISDRWNLASFAAADFPYVARIQNRTLTRLEVKRHLAGDGPAQRLWDDCDGEVCEVHAAFACFGSSEAQVGQNAQRLLALLAASGLAPSVLPGEGLLAYEWLLGGDFHQRPCYLDAAVPLPILPSLSKGTAPHGFAVLSGQRVVEISNYHGDVGHAAILGPTGAGKSVLLAHLVRCLARTHRVMAIDRDGGLRRSAHLLGAGYRTGTLDNPYRRAAADWLVEWWTVVLSRFGLPSSRARSLVQVLYRTEMTRARLVKALRRLPCDFEAAQAFLAQPEFDEDPEPTDFGNLEFFNFEASVPILLYAFGLFRRSLPARTALCVDEAWQLESVQSTVTEHFRTARKLNGAVILASQLAADVRHVAQNCLTFFLLPTANAEEYRAAVPLTDQEVKTIESLRRKRDYFYWTPERRFPFRLAFGSDGPEVMGV